jgi:hypothetical protein
MSSFNTATSYISRHTHSGRRKFDPFRLEEKERKKEKQEKNHGYPQVRTTKVRR